MSTVTSTTGPRLIVLATVAATGLATGAVIAQVAVDTEVAAGIGAGAAGVTADRPDRDRSRRRAFLIVARQAAGL
jgi:hypothetical protein